MAAHYQGKRGICMKQQLMTLATDLSQFILLSEKMAWKVILFQLQLVPLQLVCYIHLSLSILELQLYSMTYNSLRRESCFQIFPLDIWMLFNLLRAFHWWRGKAKGGVGFSEVYGELWIGEFFSPIMDTSHIWNLLTRVFQALVDRRPSTTAMVRKPCLSF